MKTFSKILLLFLFSSLAMAQGPSVKIDLTDMVKNQLGIGNGGTGASTAAAALANLGGVPSLNPVFTGTITTPLASGFLISIDGVLSSSPTISTDQLPSALAGQTLYITYTGTDDTPVTVDTGGSSLSNNSAVKIK